jgi:hypothetical protein
LVGDLDQNRATPSGGRALRDHVRADDCLAVTDFLGMSDQLDQSQRGRRKVIHLQPGGDKTRRGNVADLLASPA